MNAKLFPTGWLVVAAFAAALLAPAPSGGQSGDEINLVQLTTDVVAQQATIMENQAQIDAKLAKIAESIRLARIYAGRAGGKVP